MITLSKGGAYLLNGNEVIEVGDDSEEILKSKLGQNYLTKEEAAKNTMAYNILNSHNTSGNMEKLQIKFDKLTSHDITFVGIIQTARASGLEKFPIPYVLTNCHNSLCAVGGTINEDDHMFGLTCAKKYGGVYKTGKGSGAAPSPGGQLPGSGVHRPNAAAAKVGDIQPCIVHLLSIILLVVLGFEYLCAVSLFFKYSLSQSIG